MVDISPEVKEKLAQRERCRKDLLYLASVLGYDFVSSVHRELFDQFFKLDSSKPWAEQSDIRKILVLWSRGHYKTTSVIVFIIQIILCFPDIRILLMRGSFATTQDLLWEIKCHFNGENPKSRLQDLFPEFCKPPEKALLGTATHFTTPARKAKGLPQATVTVATPRSIKTGQHYDIGFFDDVVNESNYDTLKKLNKVKRDYHMCMPLLDPPHYAVVTGTRYAFGELYEDIIRNNVRGEWRVSVTTCYLPNGQIRFPQQKAKDGRLIGFTEEDLNLLREANPETFASQYLNQPIQRGGRQLPRVLLEANVIDPASAPALSDAVFFIDLASSEGDRADDSVIVVGKHDDRMKMYCVEVRGGRWAPPILAQNIIAAALLYRPVRILIEKTASGVYFADLLKLMARNQGLELPVDFLKVSSKDDAKAVRISTLAPLLKAKRFFFFAGITRWEQVLKECEEYSPGSRGHDDYPDTLGYMAQVFGGESLAMPISKALPRDPILAMVQIADQQRPVFSVQDESPDDGADGFLAF